MSYHSSLAKLVRWVDDRTGRDFGSSAPYPLETAALNSLRGEKPIMAKRPLQEPITACKIGDYVNIRHFDGRIGRVIELSGPIGPGGQAVDRVTIGRGSRPDTIVLLGDQMDLALEKSVKIVG